MTGVALILIILFVPLAFADHYKWKSGFDRERDFRKPGAGFSEVWRARSGFDTYAASPYHTTSAQDKGFMLPLADRLDKVILKLCRVMTVVLRKQMGQDPIIGEADTSSEDSKISSATACSTALAVLTEARANPDQFGLGVDYSQLNKPGQAPQGLDNPEAASS